MRAKKVHLAEGSGGVAGAESRVEDMKQQSIWGWALCSGELVT